MEDPIKRIPGASGGVNQAIHSSREFEQDHDKFLNRTNVHKADSISLQPGDIGYRTHKNHVSIITYQDIEVRGRGDYAEYKDINEADAHSKLSLPAYREMSVRNGEWTDLQEAHYQWEMALARSRAVDLYGYQYSSKELEKHDQDLLKTYTYNGAVLEVKKPKSFSQDTTADEISKVYWKTAVQPLIPSTIKGTNDEKLHFKLLLEGRDGAAMQSAVKLGLKELIPFYDKDGNFNSTPYTDDHTIFPGWQDTGIQVETQFSQGKKTVTRGSQITRMAAMNLMSGGESVANTEEEKEKIRKEIQTNDHLLKDLTEWGYQELLGKLGISENNGSYEIKDWQVVVDYIKANNRDLDDNTLAALHINEDNDGFKTPLEAIPSYTALKGVLFSLVDKQIASPKTSGGGFVMASSWGTESGARPDQTGNDTLKFYTKEEPWMEIALPNWFREQLVSFYTKSGKEVPSDEELVKLLNDSDLLSGVGFRIPTQDLNSIEVFKVKRFLPPVMGNTVIVPSEITKKTGGDFDVDKLNVYLKNVYINAKGEIKKVPVGNSLQEVQAAIEKEMEKGSFLSAGQLQEVDRIITEELDTIYDDSDAGKLFAAILGDQAGAIEDEITKEFVTGLKGSEDFKNKLTAIYTRKGLENAYYESLQRLLQLPQNYEKLTAINDASEYKDLRNKLNEAKYTAEEIRDKNITVNNDKKPLSYTFLLSPDTLDEIRHNNVIGKVVTGIAALAQTSNALVQRMPVVMDVNRMYLDTRNPNRLANLGDGIIRFPHNTHNGLPTLSLTRDTTGKLISQKLSQYVDGAVDVVKDTWLIELGVTPRTAGTFLLMERLGAAKEQVVYFMNQPVIQAYLTELDRQGISGLYSKAAVKEILETWGTIEEPGANGEPAKYSKYEAEEMLPDADKLLSNIRQITKDRSAFLNNDLRKREQTKIFFEFLKYQEMASDLFKLIQGINWDTAHMSDGEIFHLKNKKYENANNTLFTPASEIMKSHPVGKIRERLLDSRNAIGSFIALEHPRIVKILNQVKDTFLATDFLPNEKKYSQIAKRVNNAFINYVLQVKGKYNTRINQLLLDAKDGVAAQLDKVKKELPKDSPFYTTLDQFESFQEGTGDKSLKGIRFKRGGNDVFTKNGYTAQLRQLKDGPPTIGWTKDEEKSLYKNLVRASLIQNGVQLSPNSYSHLIPNEDYSQALSALIQNLPEYEDLQNFVDTDAFWRNNWKGDAIPKVPMTDKMIGVSDSGRAWAIPFILPKQLGRFEKGSLMKSGKLSPFLTYSPGQSSKSFMFVPETGEIITKKDAVTLGNPVINKVYLYKLVRDSKGEPIQITETYIDKNTKEEKTSESYIYKSIFALGSGNAMQEYYSEVKPSVISNNSFVPSREIPDIEIETALNNGVNPSLSANKIVNLNMSTPKSKVTSSLSGINTKPINIYAGTGENAHLSNFAIRPFVIGGDEYASVEQYFQYQKWNYLKEDVAKATFDNDFGVANKIMQTKNGAQLKSLGRQFKGLDIKDWDKNASKEMKIALKASFEQNPTALQQLLATGNATLTHTQDKGKWGTEFPKLLMEVRSELGGVPATLQNAQDILKKLEQNNQVKRNCK
jgi:ribA/ribD-fused uncharacterized protein